MKPTALLILLAVLLAACAQPSPQAITDSQIQTAIAQTMEAQGSAEQATETPSPTKTPRPTRTPAPTKTVGPTKTRVPTKTPIIEPGSRSDPYPIGLSTELWRGDDQEIKMILTVKEVIRGEEAWQKILATNRYNDPAPEGKEYVLVYLDVYYMEGPTDDTVLELDEFSFGTVSNNNILDDPTFVVNPDPEFDVSLFPGARGEGWISLLVFADDPSPILYIGNPPDGAVYFSLTE